MRAEGVGGEGRSREQGEEERAFFYHQNPPRKAPTKPAAASCRASRAMVGVPSPDWAAFASSAAKRGQTAVACGILSIGQAGEWAQAA